MNDYKNIYSDFLKDYIDDNSPFKINDIVSVVAFHSTNKYQITKIVVDSNGEFNYELTSPQSHDTLPVFYNPSAIKKFEK